MHAVVIDVGSSSMRGVLFDMQGKPLLREQRAYTMNQTCRNGVEMDPELLVGALTDIVRVLVRRAGQTGLTIDALSMTSQRSSVIAVNRDGHTLRPALMWQDRRSADICAEKEARYGETIYGLCGMPPSPVFSAPKMLWLARNEPHVYMAAHKLAGIHDFLLHRITGEWLTDASLASRTCLFDLTLLEWSPELLDIFELDADRLCRVVPQGSACAVVSPAFAALTGLRAGTPVISAGGDQQCAALGMGVLDCDEAVVNCGTGSYVLSPAKHPVFDTARKLVCNVSAVPGHWLVEGGAPAAGLVFGWFNRLFYGPDADAAHADPDTLFRAINADCALSPPGARGLLMAPCLSGKGAPYWNPHARGVFHNLSFEVRREDFARAVLEGVAAELQDCLIAVAALKGKERFAGITCAGGLTRSALFTSILCDTVNTPVEQAASDEATSHGAWLSASVALGLYSDLPTAMAAAGTRERTGHFEPDAARHTLYARQGAARRHIYEAVDMARVHALLDGVLPDAALPDGGLSCQKSEQTSAS